MDRGVTRNLLRGDKRGGSGGRKSPSGVQGQSPGGDLGGFAPRSRRQMLISSSDGGNMHPCHHLATPLLVDSDPHPDSGTPYPNPDPDCHQNLIDWSVDHALPVQNIWSKSVWIRILIQIEEPLIWMGSGSSAKPNRLALGPRATFSQNFDQLAFS